MTKILRMETKGFKSFADKTDMVFGDNFNVILGPNGSGKSNVFDALCFVLGKSGSKGLRAEKSANLIYNGGKTKQPAKQGEVSIFLDNSEGTFPVEKKEIKITRIIKSSGQSIYKINDEKHTREQLLELLRSASIDPNGYNIILQGDIVRLVEMSPNERRGIIEEIAGISVYEEKKQKASKELEKIEKNINDAELIMKEREGYLDELKKEKDQAINYKELSERLKSIKATVVKLDLEEKKQKNSGFEEEKKSQQEKIDKINDEIKELKKEFENLKKEASKINEEVEKRGETKQIQVHKEVENLKVDIAKKKETITGLNNEKEKTKNQIKSYNEHIKELKANSQEEIKEQKNLQENIRQLEKQKKELEQKISDFKKKNNLEGAAGIDAKIDDIDKQAEQLEKEIYDIRSRQQENMREKDRLEVQINGLDDKISKVKEVEKENSKELEKLKQMKKNFKQATNDLQKCLTKDSSLASQVNNAKSKLENAKQELAKIRVRQAAITERQNANKAVKEIVKNKNKFNGVFGTVSELGNVDPKYSKALDSAAGAKLNSIVVKDEKVASNCIKFLKDNHLGSATFLPLNKIKGRDKKNLSAKGVVGSAIDLVSFEPKFRPVFKYVFGSTFVVENIDVARRIGIGSNKMVTIEGDICEVSGAMRGGYSNKKFGSGFQEKSENSKNDNLEKTVNENEELVTILESERSKNQENIDKLREHKAELEGEIIKKEKSLHLESEDLEVSKNLKKEFNEKLKKVEIDLQKINDELSQKNKKLADLKVEKQKLKAQVTDIRNPTKIAELNAFNQKLDNVKSDLIKKNAELETKKKNIDEGKNSEISNYENQKNNMEQELNKIDEKKETLNKEIQENKTQLEEKEEKEKEFYAEFKEFFNKRKELEKQIEEKENNIIKKEEQSRSLEEKKNNISLEMARFEAEIKAYQQEFKQYEGVELLQETDKEKLKKEAWSVDQKLSKMGNVNMKALEIYERVNEEFQKIVNKKKVLTDEREKILMMISELDTKKKDLFLKVFNVVNDNFKKIFQILSTKGQAEMELESPKSPFEGGMMIKVRLKGKKFMDIRSLSGGEKTLTALAFIFAVQEHNPASFYIFDEVDAALDKRNSEKLANLVKNYSEKAQYIVISHNDGLIGCADNLYGVSMNEDGKSKVVSLKV
ncbi:MAG: chromosome segregation protein SMC [Nanobdellota archaeon]